ncbi:hypothetical protein PHYSODRAFT_483168 [Phytophthora sojae]|uniref:Cas12f1-like TNB domain-containing protein n=1 Tax=Phytophthora sojae (strain P6497) TaxID=1094619 RepID=G4YV31_PHYSP|nr:hypothetical protein PHYSODRAFT_483168 [Phytophthora sojae]EGZ23701.1 hypothetical protein PHYSODRAFT_483168 [Phytophthora sojae]|eukprot:XP_009518989.1 hypothetical protein PHYSODRAFT_483168 [Phytophthora sojae]
MEAIDALTKQLVPIPSPQVCVAFRDRSYQDGLRGIPRAPVKAFRKALEQRATVLLMDEFRTSKLCSCCHQSLRRARQLINRNVLCCKKSLCRNRDVNAAINILEHLKCRLLDLGRLATFQP